MTNLGNLLEDFAGILVALRPDSPDDLSRLGSQLRSIVDKTRTEPSIQALAKKAMEVLECADFPMDVASLADLNRIANTMIESCARGEDEPAPVAASPDLVARDPDTIALFGEFFEEAEDALADAERILMEAGEGGISKENVHALFRVFHTLKGVAGFLELDEISRVAHHTETLLGNVREGTLELGPSAFECLLQVTTMMGKLVSGIAAAVQASQRIPIRGAEVTKLVAWIEAETRGEARSAADDAADFAAKAEEPAEAGGTRQRATLKVDVERVDGMLEMIGELVLLESMLAHAQEMNDVRANLMQLAKITRNLQGQAMRMRMVPVHAQFQRLPRIVRDTAKKAGKDVQLVLEGASTEVDRGMVERLGDPLVHMLRNAVDHGVEGPADRRAAGKPEQATIVVRAFHEGSSVIIEVADDGRGLNRDAILKKARAQGLVREDQVLSDDEVNHLIFEPGFSTAAKITELSGRGVGMDVVKKTIQGMRGRVVIRTAPGRGTTFRLVLPMTLAIIEATVVRVGTDRFVIPSLSMVESLRPTAWMMTTMGGHRELVRFRGAVLPLFRAADLFGAEPAVGLVPDHPVVLDGGAGAREDVESGMLVVVDCGGERVGLLVDEVIGQQQVVVKNLDGTIAQSDSFVGAAILSDGRVALIINVDDLGRLGEAHNGRVRAKNVEEGSAA
ncbi:chemotaxis protein CheA [Myxococcota bacterium]|nr:chemotaxis protein CheA [Myxococcota bacterium]